MRCPIAHPPLRRENIEKEMGLMRECVCAHADIYVVADEDGAQMVMKIHRCGPAFVWSLWVENRYIYWMICDADSVACRSERSSRSAITSARDNQLAGCTCLGWQPSRSTLS